MTASLIFGLASNSKDRRPNAPCLDGHTVEFTPVGLITAYLDGLTPAKVIPF